MRWVFYFFISNFFIIFALKLNTMNSKNINDGLNLFEKGKVLFNEVKTFVEEVTAKESEKIKGNSNTDIKINGKEIISDVVTIDGIKIEFKHTGKSIEVNVTAQNIKKLSSINGNIKADVPAGVDSIKTTNGNITVKNGDIGSVKTVNGNVTL